MLLELVMTEILFEGGLHTELKFHQGPVKLGSNLQSLKEKKKL